MASNSSCLILFAKVPRPGQVKTRLCPPLSAEQAARLCAAFLRDIVQASLAQHGAQSSVILAIQPWDQREELRGLPGPPSGLELMAQEGADLGERMQRAFQAAFARGFASVVLRNTDSPLLPSSCVAQAFEGLSSPGIDVVLGPDLGGGYYLVGLTKAQGALFEALPLGSKKDGDSVFAMTLARARGLELSTQILAEQADIDQPQDLARLVVDVRAAAATAPQTARVLDELQSEGVCF